MRKNKSKKSIYTQIIVNDEEEKESNKHEKERSNSIIKLQKDDEIDEIFKNITLKKPRNAFSQYVIHEAADIKLKTGSKFNLKEELPLIISRWGKLNENEKKKYQKLFEEEKKKYQNDLLIVRHYLFFDYNDNILRKPTAYYIFLQERLREGIEKGINPQEVKNKASKDWRIMENKDKKKYLDLKKLNDNWFVKAEKTKRVTALSIFLSKKFDEAKKLNKQKLKLGDIAPLWKSLSKEEKENYEKYADNLNEERRRLQDLYDITHGVKPRRPAGAYKEFLQEKAKKGELKSIHQGKELWEKLKDEEKEVYLNKAKLTQLAYRYKKMIYDKKIKKILPKKPGGAFCYYLKEKKGNVLEYGENFIKHYREEWEKLDSCKKEYYENKAKKGLKKYYEKMKKYDNKIFDIPKKPLNAYKIFLSATIKMVREEEEILDTQKEDKYDPATLLKTTALEWNELKDEEKKIYEKIAEKELKIYKIQLKEFNQNGYYTKREVLIRQLENDDENDVDIRKNKTSRKNTKKINEDDKDDVNDESNIKKSTRRKKRQPSDSKTVHYRKKGGSRTKSISKTQEFSIKTKSNKNK